MLVKAGGCITVSLVFREVARGLMVCVHWRLCVMGVGAVVSDLDVLVCINVT